MQLGGNAITEQIRIWRVIASAVYSWDCWDSWDSWDCWDCWDCDTFTSHFNFTHALIRINSVSIAFYINMKQTELNISYRKLIF